MGKKVERFLEITKNVLSVVLVLIFQYPNKRFERINGLNNDRYEGIEGHVGEVVEPVTRYKGKVRYSGAIWKARLSDEEETTVIDKGHKVKILSASGASLIVVRRI